MNLSGRLAQRNERSEPRVVQTLECDVGEFVVQKYTVAHAAQPDRFRQRNYCPRARRPANCGTEVLFRHAKS